MLKHTRSVRRLYDRGDDLCDVGTPLEIFVRRQTKILMEEAFVIDLERPFLERDQRSRNMLLAARLPKIFDLDAAETPLVAEWDSQTLVDPPEHAPPPLVGARSTTVPPGPSAAICRVKEVALTN